MDNLSGYVNTKICGPEKEIDMASRPPYHYYMLMEINWQIIDQSGARVGAKDDARRKWRERRSVPPSWQIRIVEDLRAKGVPISFADFERALKATPSSEAAA